MSHSYENPIGQPKWSSRTRETVTARVEGAVEVKGTVTADVGPLRISELPVVKLDNGQLLQVVAELVKFLNAKTDRITRALNRTPSVKFDTAQPVVVENLPQQFEIKTPTPIDVKVRTVVPNDIGHELRVLPHDACQRDGALATSPAPRALQCYFGTLFGPSPELEGRAVHYLEIANLDLNKAAIVGITVDDEYLYGVHVEKGERVKFDAFPIATGGKFVITVRCTPGATDPVAVTCLYGA